MNVKDGKQFKLKEGALEGKLIQTIGADTIIHTKELWNDKPALLALMREDNQNADSNLPKRVGFTWYCEYRCY